MLAVLGLTLATLFTGCVHVHHEKVDPTPKATLDKMDGVGDVESKYRVTDVAYAPSGSTTNIHLVEFWQSPEGAQKDLRAQQQRNKIPTQTRVGVGVGLLCLPPTKLTNGVIIRGEPVMYDGVAYYHGNDNRLYSRYGIPYGGPMYTYTGNGKVDHDSARGFNTTFQTPGPAAGRRYGRW